MRRCWYHSVCIHYLFDSCYVRPSNAQETNATVSANIFTPYNIICECKNGLAYKTVCDTYKVLAYKLSMGTYKVIAYKTVCGYISSYSL